MELLIGMNAEDEIRLERWGLAKWVVCERCGGKLLVMLMR